MPKGTLYEQYEEWFKYETTQAFWVHLAVFLFSFVLWGMFSHWFFKVGAIMVFLFTGHRLLLLIKRRMQQ